jgi:hypothetical protein
LIGITTPTELLALALRFSNGLGGLARACRRLASNSNDKLNTWVVLL